MKICQFTFLLVFLFCLLSLSSLAQNTEAGNSNELIATRNGKEIHYKRNVRLSLSIENDSSSYKVKGFFAGVVEGHALLIHTKNGNDTTRIPIENITTLKRIKPNKRIVYSAVGIALIGAGAAVIGGEGNSPASSMRTALMIPVIGVGAYFLYAVPASLFYEKLNEKKRSKGWRFSYQ